MQVKDIMTPGTQFIAAEASLREAAETMRDRDVGFLPVRSGGQLVGVITDRDVALRPAAQSRPHDATTVRDVMTPKAHAIQGNAPVAGAAAAMKERGVRRLLIVDDSSRLVGVVSVSDIAARAPDPTLASDVLGHLAAARALPGTPERAASGIDDPTGVATDGPART